VKRPRVLVVDDSAFARTTLTKILRATQRIDVIATARDGADALEQIAALDPDIVTLDLTMPNVDGLAVLRALHGHTRPRVIVVSSSNSETELGLEAIALGAIAIVAKPTALASERLRDLGDELIETVLAAGGTPPTVVELAPVSSARVEPIELVMIGTSTGGPQALTRVLPALPADLAAPIAIALHIPPGYTAGLAERLDGLSALHVVEATDGLVLRPGLAVLARGGHHLFIERVGAALIARLASVPLRPYTPSVDELFLSGVRAVGGRALGVILTGMGDDGLSGARAIADAGGALLTEAAATCIVYGMPRCVHEAGIGAVPARLERIAKEIADRV
jgi:two-component system chemotaxis response regulator CheB